jgi:Recombination endonuclease VII
MMANNRIRMSDEERKSRSKAAGKKWRAANIERERERSRKRYMADRESYMKKAIEWRLANPERFKEHMKKAYRKFRDNNPELVKLKNRKHTLKKYGLTIFDFDGMLAVQNGCCAACGVVDPGSLEKGWAVDHCHDKNVVRGILCFSCNVVLGHVRDDVEHLEQLIGYLKKHQQPVSSEIRR